jgi:hypothetical protein
MYPLRRSRILCQHRHKEESLKKFLVGLLALWALLTMSCEFIVAPGGAPVASSICFVENDGSEAIVASGTATFTTADFTAPDITGAMSVTFTISSGGKDYRIFTMLGATPKPIKPFAAVLPFAIYRQAMSSPKSALVFGRIENSDLWQCGGFTLDSSRPFSSYKITGGQVMLYTRLTYDGGGGSADMFIRTDNAIMAAILKSQE